MEVEKWGRSKLLDKTGQGQPLAGPSSAPGGPRRIWGEVVGGGAERGDQVAL